MKALITTLFLFVSLIMVKAQEAEQNRFQQSENAATGTTSAATNGGAIGSVGAEQVQGPGNPPGDEEIPIDNYLTILALLGSSLVIYKYRYKIKTL